MEIPYPSEREIYTVEATTQKIIMLLVDYLNSKKLLVEPRPVGSTAKGTFLVGDSDIDMFVLTDKPYQAFYETCKLFPEGKEKTGQLKIWNFIYQGYDIDLVFTDPFHIKVQTLQHNDFYKKNLTFKMKREVVLAKAFFKTMGVYGAENGGITGVCIEELIRQHKTFKNVSQYFLSLGRDKRPFIQDPVLSSPRDLLASVIPRRYTQIIHTCKVYLNSPGFDYNPMNTWNFIRLPQYFKYGTIFFHRKDDKGKDFSSIYSISEKVSRQMRSIDNEITIDFDVFLDDERIVIVYKVRPLEFEILKERCVGFSTIKEDKKKFKDAHPDWYVSGNLICAKVPRLIKFPETYFYEEIWNRARGIGYEFF